MMQKKICMMGAFAAGKTSLVSRYARNMFSEKYLTTVGVRIERKLVRAGTQDLDLILWDLHGEDEFQKVRQSYLRGTSGCILVVDGTRRDTLDTALQLHQEAKTALGDVPCVYAVNKADLRNAWEIDDAVLHSLRGRAPAVVETSAKMDLGVEEAFSTLVRAMVNG
jgi:small GTP-binding protein